jgi:hypothetical protein
MSKDTGGPAFPVLPQFDERRGEYTNYGSDGMSIRDFFAAQALAGGLQQDARDDMDCAWWYHAEDIAKRAYGIADAMLAEREKP